MDQAGVIHRTRHSYRLCLDNWEEYYHADERDPLVQLAVYTPNSNHPSVCQDGVGIIPLYLYERRSCASQCSISRATWKSSETNTSSAYAR